MGALQNVQQCWCFLPTTQLEGCSMPQFANGGGAGGPKARKGLLSADGRAVKTDARVTCQIIWQPGYLTPNMWMASQSPLPSFHSLWFCRSAQMRRRRAKLVFSQVFFVKSHLCALCQLISNASLMSTINRYLARDVDLQYKVVVIRSHHICKLQR